MKSRIGLAVMGLIVLTGCGGGSSSPSVTALSTTTGLSTKTRSLKPGDQWVYTVTGQTTNPGSAPVTLTGTLTLSLTSQTVKGAGVLALTSALAVTGSDGQNLNTTLITYLTQDATTGDISEVADNNDTAAGANGLRTLTAPQVIFPGTWFKGLSKSVSMQFDTGETQTYNINVTGNEIVQTPIGAFSTWIANTGTDSGIAEYWAPQLGAPVKLTVQIGDAGSGALMGTALLKSTNVVH